MKKIETDIVVIGAGPGGYAAAFYAADKGLKVTLIEKDDRLGGVCLNRGCIPSKALLNVAHVIEDAHLAEDKGVSFSSPTLNPKKMMSWKDSIISKLSGGISQLAKGRGVTVMTGRAYFESSDTLRVETSSGQQRLTYKKAIIATGSSPAMPAAFDLGNPRIMNSTDALTFDDIPKKLLIVGAGYIGMELGTVYAALGSEIVVVEALPTMLAGADPDLVRPLMKSAESMFKEMRFSHKVQKMATAGKKIKVKMSKDGEKALEELYDKVLVSVGRVPNSTDLGLENTSVKLDDKGFIQVKPSQETDDPKIMAIGDVAGGILLAHKASKEARVAIEVLCGEASSSDQYTIPAVVFTDPEIAWCGLTETEAKEQKTPVKVVKFPWAASGRALTLSKSDGLTKLILEPDTERVLGVGIVGRGAGELIAEGNLAVEMSATATDLAEVIHAHPTLSETIMESAEAFFGHATHIISKAK